MKRTYLFLLGLVLALALAGCSTSKTGQFHKPDPTNTLPPSEAPSAAITKPTETEAMCQRRSVTDWHSRNAQGLQSCTTFCQWRSAAVRHSRNTQKCRPHPASHRRQRGPARYGRKIRAEARAPQGVKAR